MPHPAILPLKELLADCRIQQTRRSGPGGQHRNKVQTAIVIEHIPSQILGEASERRSQLQNRNQAIHRLRINLAIALRTPTETALPEVWNNRLQGNRISVSGDHEDFPALLAIALDHISANDFSISTAAKELEVSTSQLIKMLKIENQALALVNRERKARELGNIH